MASIIKAADRNAAVQRTAFNFDDMASHADAYVAQVREQATRIVAEAHKQADQIRKAAEIEGLRAAKASQQAQVDAETGRRAATMLPALRATVDELEKSKQAWLAHWEQTGVTLASRIAERILRRELAEHPTLPVTLVRESLELAVGADGVRILMNPADLEHLRPQIEPLTREVSRLGRAELVADPRITAGGCRLETSHGSIDQQIEAQLKRIEEELT